MKTAKAILMKSLTEHQLDNIHPDVISNVLKAMEEFHYLSMLNRFPFVLNNNKTAMQQLMHYLNPGLSKEQYDIVKQFLEKEKQQIINAYENGIDVTDACIKVGAHIPNGASYYTEQYYTTQLSNIDSYDKEVKR